MLTFYDQKHDNKYFKINFTFGKCYMYVFGIKCKSLKNMLLVKYVFKQKQVVLYHHC